MAKERRKADRASERFEIVEGLAIKEATTIALSSSPSSS